MIFPWKVKSVSQQQVHQAFKLDSFHFSCKFIPNHVDFYVHKTFQWLSVFLWQWQQQQQQQNYDNTRALCSLMEMVIEAHFEPRKQKKWKTLAIAMNNEKKRSIPEAKKTKKFRVETSTHISFNLASAHERTELDLLKCILSYFYIYQIPSFFFFSFNAFHLKNEWMIHSLCDPRQSVQYRELCHSNPSQKISLSPGCISDNSQ